MLIKLTDEQRRIMVADKARLVSMQHAIDAEIVDRRLALMRGNDAIPSALLGRAVEYAVQQGVYKKDGYYVWRTALPSDSDMPAGASTKVFKVYDRAGKAGWYRGGGKHNKVAFGMNEVRVAYKSATISFDVDWLEMRASDYAGVNVEAEKAAACYKFLDAFVEDLVFVGDDAVGVPPLIDHPLIDDDTLVTGAWDDPATTTDEIIADIQTAIDDIVGYCVLDEDAQNLKIDCMLDPTLYRVVTSRIANTYTLESIAQVLSRVDGKFGRFIMSPKHAAVDGGDNVSFGPFSDAGSALVALSVDAQPVPRTEQGGYIEQPFETKAFGWHCKWPHRFCQRSGAKAS